MSVTGSENVIALALLSRPASFIIACIIAFFPLSPSYRMRSTYVAQATTSIYVRGQARDMPLSVKRIKAKFTPSLERRAIGIKRTTVEKRCIFPLRMRQFFLYKKAKTIEFRC